MTGLAKYFRGKRYLKLLFVFIVTVFSLIIQVGVLRPFGGLDLGIIDYVITGLLSMVYLELFFKEVKIEKVVVILILVGSILITFAHRGDLFLRYIFLIVLHVLGLVFIECDNSSSDDIKRKGITMLVGIVISSVGLLDGKSHYNFFMGQLAILFVITYVALLRASRNFQYKLKENTVRERVVYIMFSTGLLINNVQSLFAKVIYFLLFIVDIIVIKVVEILSYIVGPIFGQIKINSRYNIRNILEVNNMEASKNALKEGRNLEDSGINTYVFKTIEVIICLIGLFLIYKLVKKLYNFEKNTDNVDLKIEREVIENNKSTMVKKLKKEKKPITIKDKILYTYKEFLIKSKESGLYRQYMTGQQVQSRVGAEVHSIQKELNAVTKVYNEAKFSNHNISEEKFKFFEENYHKIKEKL